MKHFIIDYNYVSFSEFKAHGGGDFAIRLVEYFLLNDISFGIINNRTNLFKEYDDVYEETILKSDIRYFNPLYVGGDDNTYKYSIKYLYIHGVRMLEMPFDSYSYKYYSFPKNITNIIKYRFFSKYYKRKEQRLLNMINDVKGKVEILTPSIHSKFIFLSQKNFNSKVTVLPPFLNKNIVAKDPILPFSEPYILFLNADRWVKNSYLFLKAFDELFSLHKIKNVKTVLIGKPRFYKKFKKGTFFLDYVEREELEGLIKNCLFLAYPSLNEGFGYPPVDSFKYNVPVLCTSISAPNIIYNGNVVFTDPNSVEEIKSRILYMLDLIAQNEFDNLEERYLEINKKIQEKWIQII